MDELFCLFSLIAAYSSTVIHCCFPGHGLYILCSVINKLNLYPAQVTVHPVFWMLMYILECRLTSAALSALIDLGKTLKFSKQIK